MAAVLPGVSTKGRLAETGAAGAIVEGAVAWRFGWSAALPAYLYCGAVLTAVAATDLALRRIPNRVISLVGLFLGWLGWLVAADGVLLAFLGAALVVIGRRVASPARQAPLPLAPFMAGGALAAMLWVR